MISSVVIINTKGEILIYKTFKDDILRSEIQNFCSIIVATKEYRENPILLLNGTSYISVPYKDLIFLATTKTNINCAMTVQFLYQLISIFKAYFYQEVNQSEINKKFSLVYEILDEVMDYGCPQFTDPSVLKTYIQEDKLDSQILKVSKMCSGMTSLPTGAISWRAQGIYYKKNQILIDVIQSVNAIFSSQGNLLRANVSGVINLNCLLSGMPDCKLGMNDKLLMERQLSKKAKISDDGITIDDMKFHQCVRLQKFDKERSITFIPPDGFFELMEYRITENVCLPFKIMPIYTQISETKMEIRVKLKSIFDKNLNAKNVLIKIPCPKNTASVNINTLIGKVKYEPQQRAIVWRIKKFQGDFQSLLQCQVTLSSTSKQKVWAKPPISMQFSIQMFTASGLRIRFLKIYEKSGYKTNKLIKTATNAGDYYHRL